MRSRLYRGEVIHSRLEPIRHAFSYPLYGYVFDLDELPHISDSVKGFGYNSRNVVSLFDSDYLTVGDESIREKLTRVVNDAGCGDGIVRIELVTSARYLNYVFNPVSFYYCYREDGSLRAAVAEVNNTFHERHLYILDEERRGLPGFMARYTVPKEFHVSPFNDREGTYDFHFSPLSASFDIRVNIVKDGGEVFVSSLRGVTLPLTSGNLFRTVAKAPLQALMTIPRIYYQAGLLYFRKKMPIVSKPNPMSPDTIRVAPPLGWEKVCLTFIKWCLRGIQRGSLLVRYPEGHEESFSGTQSGERAVVHLNNYYLFPKLVRDGSIGLGDSYVAKDWETPDLATTLKFFLDNWSALADYRLNLLKPTRIGNLISHFFKRNSLKGSKENISAHYDLSNEMFRLFLDPSLTYSSAMFASPTESLESAQLRKVDAILDMARVEKGDHVLEIGSGWGTLALRAAERFGCQVTSISLSEEQLRLARERAKEGGHDGRVQFLERDYRKVQGQFDKIVSVEMMEAVGREFLPSFFETCERLLKPNGLAVLQVIGFPDYEYSRYLKRQDWIQRRIFPGSHLPSLTSLLTAVSKHSKLIVDRIDNIGPHYARTLKEWNERFFLNQGEIQKLGFDERFCRTWQFYLASCEAEFATRWLTVYQIVLTRPNNHLLVREDRKALYGHPKLEVVGGSGNAKELTCSSHELDETA